MKLSYQLCHTGCIERICSPDAHLTDNNVMAKEVQDFILFFLNMRNKLLPTRLTSTSQEESQEDYGLPAVDWDDPALFAAFGGDDDARKRRDREDDVANVRPFVSSARQDLIVDSVSLSDSCQSCTGWSAKGFASPTLSSLPKT